MAATVITGKPQGVQRRVVGMAAAVVVVLLLLQPVRGGGGGDAAEQLLLGECKGQGALLDNCRDYVMRGGPRKPPSAACCAAVRGADLPCLCKMVTLPIAAIVDIGKVCYVARTCGASVPPPGSQCGAVPVPRDC